MGTSVVTDSTCVLELSRESRVVYMAVCIRMRDTLHPTQLPLQIASLQAAARLTDRLLSRSTSASAFERGS